MILGAGIMQVPGIRIAKNKGWQVIVVDGNPSAMARGQGDVFEVVDLKDRDGLLALAQRYAAAGGLDGIFTAGTDFSTSVAWVAEKLGLPGITYATAMRATDKCLMRKAFQDAAAPSPNFACWAGEGDPAALRGPGLDFPLVVKPVDNMGARGVRRVDTVEALRDACGAARALSRSSRVIVEEFMEGPELSLDAIVYRGGITVCGIADRHISFPPAFVEIGHTMPTELGAADVRRIEDAFAAGIRAIGIDNGAAKGDMKLTPRGPMIGEIAARLSGGYMSGWTFPFSSGVEVTAAAMNIAVGEPPGDLLPRFNRTCAERGIISIPGTVRGVEGEETARRVPGVREVFLRVSAGDEAQFPANNVQKCGNVIGVGEDRDQAIAAARQGIAALLVRLRGENTRTSSFLFREKGNEAFGGLPPDACRLIAGLPPYRGIAIGGVLDGVIAVEALPGLDDAEAEDWHGETFADAVRQALLCGGAVMSLPGADGAFMLSGLFWRAMVRGSRQGGLYVLDSVRQAAARGRLWQFLESQ
jgi:biotin carboxylase